MKLLNPKTRITMGLVGILTSLVMLAFFLEIIPDRNAAIRNGRAALAETIAVYSTALVQTGGSQRLRDDFNLLAGRHDDLLTLALRHESGKILVATGDHEKQWEKMAGEYSKDSQIRVPIWAGKEKWGELELRFTPLTGKGVWNHVRNSPMILTILFIGLVGFVVYYYYLGKVLRQLDPSQAIPARVRSALDTMAEGLLILDRKEQIVLSNSAFAELIGKSPDDLLGYRAGELPWTDREGNQIEKARHPWVRSLAEGKIQRDRTIRLQLPDGTSRTFKTNCSPVLGEEGNRAGVLISFDDITELEEKETELLNSKMEAEEANKAKSAFLANMSHEIRTPMNAILGFTEILKRGYVKNKEESIRYLDTIHSSGKNLLELINDILDLSKVESGRFGVERMWVDPYAIIREVIGMLAVKASEKDIDLTFNAVGALPEKIETDPGRFRQIVFNLVGNSIKFTDRGAVGVTCRYDDTGPYLTVDISDTGIGMSKDALKTIFDPFVQADSSVTRRFGGTGLGLTISRSFAQALGGDIKVTSELEKGSTFSVNLSTGDLKGIAFVQADEVDSLRQETKAEMGWDVRWRFPHARVLVVDDGKENRELVKLFLEQAGLTVDEAENGQIGVEKAVGGNYKVILMDVQMPVMDGFTATGILREKGLNVPIIALTANAMKGFETQCIEAGYSEYLSKPINIDRFMERMAGLLNGRKVEADAVVLPIPENAPDASRAKSPETDTSPIFSNLPGNIEKFRNIIIRFVRRLDEQLGAMENAATQGDMKTLAELAHWLKGAGGTVGFDVFTKPAAQLEMVANNENKKHIPAAISSLRALAARIAISDDGAISAKDYETDAAAPSAQRSSVTSQGREQKPVVSRLANHPRLKRTILSFVEKLDEKIERMETALEAKNMEELAGLAHWLKGAGGTVGYDDFTKPAEDLESSARAGHVEKAGHMFDEVKSLVSAIVPPTGEFPQKKDQITNIRGEESHRT